MKVTTIAVSRDDAAAKIQQYRAIPDHLRTDDDRALLRMYRLILKGEARVLNLHAAFHETGLNDHGQPKLAIARADWRTAVFHPNINRPHRSGFGGGMFTETRRLDPRLRANLVNLPPGTFNDQQLTRKTLRSPVPHIPPQHRPRSSYLRNFYILFEVECWEEYPVDPFLLKHIHGALYSVMAEWELTPLEASLLTALTS
jgi:hypothetical protein